MRVLWFTVTSSLYENKMNGHNGGGWISSLEKIIRDTDITLGVSFEHKDKILKKTIDGVSYYPINAWVTKKSRIEKIFDVNADERYIIPNCLKVIEDFKPDVIQVFGSEWVFGLISKYTHIPVVIHMQGSLPSYYNARFPIGVSLSSLILSKSISYKNKFFILKNDYILKMRAKREESILRSCTNYMGRTHWDKSIVTLYNDKSNYYHCEEALRDSFINNGKKWEFKTNSKITLVSTISGPWYKGMDLILKTAKLLKENINIDFNWKVFGVKDSSFYENHYNINALEVNVKLQGVVPEELLFEELVNSTFYIHPSYIDNSPNSICEAQILGVPVISTDVGGISSLIKNNLTGMLVPANDPVAIASLVKKYYQDEESLKNISENSIKKAENRHSIENIKVQLLEIYENLIKGKVND